MGGKALQLIGRNLCVSMIMFSSVGLLSTPSLPVSPILHLSQCLSIVIYPSPSSSSLLVCVRLLAPYIALRLE